MGKEGVADMKIDLNIVLAVLAVFAMVVVVYFFLDDISKIEKLIDPKTFCPVEEPIRVWGFFKREPRKITSKVAIVIDATDRIPRQQAREIAAWFHEIRTSFQGKKVTVYELRENIEFSRALFEKCAPSLVETFSVDEDEMNRKFKEGFYNAFMNRIGRLTVAKEKNFSPILGTLERMFDTHDEVILISDLLQHHSEYSLYYKNDLGNHNYQAFLDSPYSKKIKNNRKGKKLTVLYVPRQKLTKRQTPELTEFWKRHMEINGGEFVREQRLTPIPKSSGEKSITWE